MGAYSKYTEGVMLTLLGITDTFIIVCDQIQIAASILCDLPVIAACADSPGAGNLGCRDVTGANVGDITETGCIGQILGCICIGDHVGAGFHGADELGLVDHTHLCHVRSSMEYTIIVNGSGTADIEEVILAGSHVGKLIGLLPDRNSALVTAQAAVKQILGICRRCIKSYGEGVFAGGLVILQHFNLNNVFDFDVLLFVSEGILSAGSCVHYLIIRQLQAHSGQNIQTALHICAGAGVINTDLISAALCRSFCGAVVVNGSASQFGGCLIALNVDLFAIKPDVTGLLDLSIFGYSLGHDPVLGGHGAIGPNFADDGIIAAGGSIGCGLKNSREATCVGVPVRPILGGAQNPGLHGFCKAHTGGGAHGDIRFPDLILAQLAVYQNEVAQRQSLLGAVSFREDTQRTSGGKSCRVGDTLLAVIPGGDLDFIGLAGGIGLYRTDGLDIVGSGNILPVIQRIGAVDQAGVGRVEGQTVGVQLRHRKKMIFRIAGDCKGVGDPILDDLFQLTLAELDHGAVLQIIGKLCLVLIDDCAGGGHQGHDAHDPDHQGSTDGHNKGQG